MIVHLPNLDHLRGKKKAFEAFLSEYVDSVDAPKVLRDANAYALTTSGKRIRPIITLLFGESSNALMHAALSLELFHTASLVADDLPCMDNDSLRRNKPSLHVAFDEQTALLTSYGMICAAFKEISQAGLSFEGSDADKRLAMALDCASELAGFSGATGGQFLDLNPTGNSLDHFEELFYKKTVTLFEVAFILGWIFAGKALGSLDLVRCAAYNFGLAFQIADDISDVEEEDSMNVVQALGEEAALAWFKDVLTKYDAAIAALDVQKEGFNELRELMLSRARFPHQTV